jgi:hypothetical protein
MPAALIALPRSPSFVIHVGPHKTGSTYLQFSFRALRGDLAARGTVFPEIWELGRGRPSQGLLMSKLRDGHVDELAPEFAALLGSGAELILISSEDLSDLDRPALERLRVLTAGHPVRIVFYVRRWSDLIPSAWQEMVKQGHYQTLPEFMLTHLLQPEESRLLNFDVRLSAFTDVFGIESVTLVSYSELSDRGVDLFEHFATNILGWSDAPTPRRLKVPNASRDVREAELLRALNAVASAHKLPASGAIRWAFDQMNYKRVPPPILAAMNRYIRKVRIDDRLLSLQRLHGALARKYMARMLPPKMAAHLFRPVVREVEIVGGDYQAEAEAGTALRDLFSQLCATLEIPLAASEDARRTDVAIS